MAHRKPVALEVVSGTDVPALLAFGPCVEVWGKYPGDLFGAWRAWQDARLTWATEQGLADDLGHLDWHRMPRELRDRAPYSRDATGAK